MTLLETIARKELEPLMDIRVIGEFNDKYLWVDIRLAKIARAYSQYLRSTFPREIREKLGRDFAWKIWLKTTDKNYDRMIEGYNFDKSHIPIYQASGVFIENYKDIYERYVGNSGNLTLYRNLFRNFLEEENY